MARSVGEAAAQGLEAGYRMALDTGDREYQRDRQSRLDAQTADQQDFVRQRQQHADALGALGQQEQALATEGAGLQATNPDLATQEDYTRRVTGVKKAKNELLQKISGYDIGGQAEKGMVDIQNLKAGDIPNTNLTRAVTVAARRPPTDYIRQGDKPAVVEQAGQDFIDGMQNDDQPKMLKGLNTMYAPELSHGVGAPSPHGGTIVGKEIVGLDHVPGSHPDDPHFVPRLRIYVNQGNNFRGPAPEGAPQGATSYYDAPLTKNRSSDPNDMVKPIGLQEALDYMHKQGQLVEVMNSPEAQAKLQEEAQQPQFDPNAYLKALAAVGVVGGKVGTKVTVIPAGGSAMVQKTDARGNDVGEPKIVQGNKKDRPETALEMAQRLANENGTTVQQELRGLRPTGRPTLFQEAQDYADANDISVQEALKVMQTGGITKTPKGGAAGEGGGGTSLKERELKRKELKDLNDSDARDEANARADLAKFDERMSKAAPSVRKDPANVTDRANMADRLKTIAARIDTRKTKLDKLVDDDSTAPTTSAKTAPVRLKFDANGNRVK